MLMVCYVIAMQTPSRKRTNRTHFIIIFIVFATVLVASATTLAYTKKWWPFAEPESTIIDGINYGPPTSEEVENSQNAKKDILSEDRKSNKNTSNDEQTTTLKKVTIGVSHADVVEDNVEIRAFVEGVVEGTGTCTATLTKSGSQPVTKSSKAFVDASTSQCQPIFIPLSQFNQDSTWTLVVTYNSPTSTGMSEKIPVNIK